MLTSGLRSQKVGCHVSGDTLCDECCSPFCYFFSGHFLSLPILTSKLSFIFQYSFKEAIARYKDDVLNNGLLTKYWSLWGPVQCLTFSVIPEHLRIVWIAFVSFFWLIIFSSIAAKGQKERELLDNGCTLEDGVSCRIDG